MSNKIKYSDAEKQQVHNFIVVAVIFAVLLGLAFGAVKQVYDYRHDYKIYTQAVRERDELMIERGQLLIEQQTFGATSQIGVRAVTQLRMFSPPLSKTVVIIKDEPQSTPRP